jgi:methyl coenzyme M reductase subunit C
LSRFALIASPLEILSCGKSSWNDCVTFGEIERHLMVKFDTITKIVIVDANINEMEYIKTNPFNVEQISTSMVKQEEEYSETSVIDLLHSSGDEISRDKLQDVDEEEEGKGKEQLPVMPEVQDHYNPEIMIITHNALAG